MIDSYLANGFFPNEPLLVLRSPDDRWTVVEGNRRAAALMILQGTDTAQDADLEFNLDEAKVSDERLAELRHPPALELDDRDEVSRYLGFRHISGLKTWGPEAKARYLWVQCETAFSRGSGRPFYDVGRQVGSNAAGVRTAYNAYNLLRGAVEVGVPTGDVEYVKRKKFGVWTRLLSTANVPVYMGLDGVRVTAYEDVRQLPERLDAARTTEVLQDLRPREGRKRAVLADSRDVTDYSDVLGDPRARKILREYDDLALARQVVEQGRLGERLGSLLSSAEVLHREVPRLNPPTESDISIAREIVAVARALLAVLRSRQDDEEDE